VLNEDIKYNIRKLENMLNEIPTKIIPYNGATAMEIVLAM
jgi:hypothetical protein